MILTQAQRKSRWAYKSDTRRIRTASLATSTLRRRRSHDPSYLPNDPSFLRASRRSLEVVWLFGLHQDTESTKEGLRSQFNDLVDVWTEETMTSSFIHEICTHRAYQRVIGLGPPAIPLILEEVLKDRRHWGWALAAITGENPDEHAGSPKEAAEAWLQWGRDHNYVPN